MLQIQIKEEMKQAMLSKDTLKRDALRGLLAAFTNELVAKGKPPQEAISDIDALAVIKRQVKQRKDSIEQFRQGGRGDLVKAEEAELRIIEVYLPTMMGKDEIRKIAEAKKTALGITDASKKGILMGAIMKETAGKADGADVKEVVDSLF
ncbi:MAG: GatB/YqeY domain-containing protein [Candidatus Lloydbacteria bacterium]|nr:GatB/YqeY domain-containing protein [Candidatus Lloydbacteria bacterium]